MPVALKSGCAGSIWAQANLAGLSGAGPWAVLRRGTKPPGWQRAVSVALFQKVLLFQNKRLTLAAKELAKKKKRYEQKVKPNRHKRAVVFHAPPFSEIADEVDRETGV